jgi:hypothetical protein
MRLGLMERVSGQPDRLIGLTGERFVPCVIQEGAYHGAS